ncbi:MAG TPA: DUF459 domain-containing protein [Acidimicrobiales bacterium]|jgi:hypothetical protein
MPTLTPTPITDLHDRPPFRRYPAGRAIAVVLLALFFSGLLDADSLVASVSSERFGSARSFELALVRPFKTVSDTLGLNLPHRWLADIGGTNQSNPPPVPPPPADAGGAASTAAISTLLDPVPRDRPAPVPKTAIAARAVHQPAPPPKPRTPTVAAPLKVWLAGDSMMGTIADAFLVHVAANPAVNASEDVQIGTGLARPDVYDWPGAIAREMQQAQPNVVVLTFGANDDQDMMAGSQYLVRATPAWQAEYARRVALIMNEVTASGRLLVWLEVPPVARPRLQQTDQIIDGILHTQAAAHPGVVIVNPGLVLAPSGTFTAYLSDGSGQPIEVRAPDGVHLTPAGAGRVLPLVLAAVRTQWILP